MISSHPCPRSLAVGTVVSFFFPPRGPDAGPPKARPCLVIAVDTGATGKMSIAYGTSAPTDANQGLDLVLGEKREIDVAGLHRPTRFVLARRVVVAKDDIAFARNARGTAVLGALPLHLEARLTALVRTLGPAVWKDACPPPARARDDRRERLPAFQPYQPHQPRDAGSSRRPLLTITSRSAIR